MRKRRTRAGGYLAGYVVLRIHPNSCRAFLRGSVQHAFAWRDCGELASPMKKRRSTINVRLLHYADKMHSNVALNKIFHGRVTMNYDRDKCINKE